jgi:hypothetical protein
MAVRHRVASWLGRFYAKRIVTPLPYAIEAAIVGSGILFLMTWAGARGRFRPWGDPIPFMEAVAKLPGMLVFCFALALVFLAIVRFPRDDL